MQEHTFIHKVKSIKHPVIVKSDANVIKILTGNGDLISRLRPEQNKTQIMQSVNRFMLERQKYINMPAVSPVIITDDMFLFPAMNTDALLNFNQHDHYTGTVRNYAQWIDSKKTIDRRYTGESLELIEVRRRLLVLSHYMGIGNIKLDTNGRLNFKHVRRRTFNAFMVSEKCETHTVECNWSESGTREVITPESRDIWEQEYNELCELIRSRIVSMFTGYTLKECSQYTYLRLNK